MAASFTMEPASAHLMGLGVLLVLLLLIATKLSKVHAALSPVGTRRTTLLDVPSVRRRRGHITLQPPTSGAAVCSLG